MIISTGMASLKEIDKIKKLFKYKRIDHHLLHCVAKYPNNEELGKEVRKLVNSFEPKQQ